MTAPTFTSSRSGLDRFDIRRILQADRIGVVAALGALVIYLWLASPFFMTGNNLTNIGSRAELYCLLRTTHTRLSAFVPAQLFCIKDKNVSRG